LIYIDVLNFSATDQNSVEIKGNIKGLTQKGNLFCKGKITSLGFKTDNDRNMFVQSFVSNSTKGSLIESESSLTKKLSLEIIKSSSQINSAIKV
jgi:hypothetical protein